MRSYTSYLLGLAGLAHAIAFPGPEPTEAVPNLKGRSPKPTNGPRLALLERAASAGVNTCGWVNGDPNSAITCNIYSGTTPRCMLYTPSNQYGMAGCCADDGDYQTCGWANSCVGLADISTACDSACLANTFVRKCTDPASPFCVSWTYPVDAIKDYGCGAATQDYSTWLTLSEIVTDQGRQTVLDLQYVPESSLTGWESTTSTSQPAAQSTTISATATPTNNDHDFPIAAVAGGAAGGVVLLAIAVGVGCYFCCIRNRRKQKHLQPPFDPNAGRPPATAISPQQPQNLQPSQYQTPPTPQLSHFDPGNSGYYGDEIKTANVAAYGISPTASTPGTPGNPFKFRPASSAPGSPQSQHSQLVGAYQQAAYPGHQPYIPPHNGAVEVHGGEVPHATLPQQLRVNSPHGIRGPQQIHQGQVYEMQS